MVIHFSLLVFVVVIASPPVAPSSDRRAITADEDLSPVAFLPSSESFLIVVALLFVVVEIVSPASEGVLIRPSRLVAIIGPGDPSSASSSNAFITRDDDDDCC
jgi:hypothetical protein